MMRLFVQTNIQPSKPLQNNGYLTQSITAQALRRNSQETRS
jgi:hypothetical protein